MTRRDRHRYRPSELSPLESRVVLSRIRVAPAVVAPLDTSGRRANLRQATVQAVQTSFDSFTRDYLESQGTYFATDAPGSVTTATMARNFYQRSINNRLDLLAAELTRAFSQLPRSLNRVSGGSPGGSLVLQSFLDSRITGTRAGSLRSALTGSGAIPLASTAGTTLTLYTDQALSAIETARANTLNAAGFLLNHTFKVGRHR